MIVLADKHINSTIGLIPPVVVLDDGGTFRASRTQRWIWSCYTDFWARVNRDATGYRKILIEDGDLGELDTKRRSVQLITANKSTILSMVRNVLEVASWDELFIVRGTPAHVGRGCWLEEEIAKDYNATPSLKLPPLIVNGKEIDQSIHSWWQIKADVHGTKMDIAHHASMGSSPWTRQNSAGKLASKALWEYRVERNVDPPDIIDRAHNHIYAEATVNNTHAYFLPSWSMTTEYGYRMGYENTLPTIGGIVHYCAGSHCFTEKYFYTPERERRIWSMKL